MVQENFLQDLERIEKKKDLLKQIDYLLNDWLNEIPENLINGSFESKNFKVRTNWFDGVLHTIEESEQLLPESFKLELYNFIKSFKERRNDSDETRTTKEEIDTVDSILKRAKEYIEKSV